MDFRELMFWATEAMRMHELKKAGMAEATRFAYHADVNGFKSYVRGLCKSPIIQVASAEEQRENWERLKKRGRG